MSKKIHGEKGITLIALVITIIIMLILAAVTINIVINGGLIGYARNAKTDYESALTAEQAGIALAEEEMAKISGGNENNGINVGGQSWAFTSDDVFGIDTSSEGDLLIQEVNFEIDGTQYDSFYIKDYTYSLLGETMTRRAVYAYSSTANSDFKINLHKKIIFKDNATVSQEFYNWFSTVATEFENNSDVNVSGQTWSQANSSMSIEGYMLQEVKDDSGIDTIIKVQSNGQAHFIKGEGESTIRDWTFTFGENVMVSQRFFEWLSASATPQTE